ncbi:MAG: hypothetical protein L6461_23815 [Anaerolineae bacterium]|nr:hypothetical protein [Anaerolineae bacterium]
MGRTFSFIGAGILFLISLCFLGYGALALIGSTSASGDSSWTGLGIGMAVVGLFLAAGGAFLVWVGVRGQKTEVVQNVTMKMDLDLPGQTKVEQMKCQSCGGVITSTDIKIMAGAPVVTCPYCQSTYQLTEEPKW